MKKVFTLLFVLCLITLLVTCSNNKKNSSGNNPPVEKKKVALLIGKLGSSSFLDDAAAGFRDAAGKNNFEYFIVECADNAAYTENARALVNEKYDLILGVGWQSGDAINTIATEFPNAVSAYAIVDTILQAENVKCINFYEQEGAYLIGMLAALTVNGESHNYGAVHATQSASSWKWRYAYMQGVLSIDPEARFVFNYVNSFSDPASAKELALQQYALGCMFINAACAGGDFGVFEAAKEKGFYTSGQDIDLTTPDNPYIVSCQIKDTFAAVSYVINAFNSGNWDTSNTTLGVADGAIGAVYVTHNTKTPRSSRLSNEDMAKLRKAVEDIKNGTINLRTLPAENSYTIRSIY